VEIDPSLFDYFVDNRLKGFDGCNTGFLNMAKIYLAEIMYEVKRCWITRRTKQRFFEKI
jgi:hypothetical protein